MSVATLEYDGVALEDKEAFIAHNLKLVHAACQKFIPRLKRDAIVDYDDLFGIGCIGLMKAYNNFKPELGYQFSTYAMNTICGAIHRWTTDHMGTITVTRTGYRIIPEILKNDWIHEDRQFIAKKLGVSKDSVDGAIWYITSGNTDSLDRVVHDEGDVPITLSEQVGYSHDFESNMVIKDYLESLSDRDRFVFLSYHVGDKSQGEIGETLGVSQVQVSRILKRLQRKAKEME